jgi:hypothetical protein
LVNLVPASASLTTATVPLVQAILSRASLPLDIVALAVCILDSLDHKFALIWRLQCPLIIENGLPSSKRHTLSHSSLITERQQVHIDSVHPEVMILAALVIAVKFMEDRHEATQYYCSVWGRDIWSHEQLNVTERCIMENLNYRIMPLCNEELITDALVDMQLAVRQQRFSRPAPADETSPSPCLEDSRGHSYSKSMGSNAAVVGLGLQLTPSETP